MAFGRGFEVALAVIQVEAVLIGFALGIGFDTSAGNEEIGVTITIGVK